MMNMDAPPVLIITYKRFDFVIRILEQLGLNKLKKVYLSVDDYYSHEREVRHLEAYLRDNQFEFEMLKWKTNVGCDCNVIEGIKWFFSKEDSGIILEDDCMPAAEFGSFIRGIRNYDLSHRNISFFSSTLVKKDTFSLYEGFTPVLWGWYSTAAYYNRFYKFYHEDAPAQLIRQVFRGQLDVKTKVVSLINYYAHKNHQKGVAWDSELFLYQLIKNETFVIPSHSLVDNIGFGTLNAAFTHTDKMPSWLLEIKQKRQSGSVENQVIQKDMEGNRSFLKAFYSEYPNNLAKLLGTLLVTYIKYSIKKRGNTNA